MRTGELLASAFIVAVLGTNLGAMAWKVNDWPIANVSMFSGRIAPTSLPRRFRLSGMRGDTPVELHAADVGLAPFELESRLLNSADPAVACSALGEAYNERRRDPTQRLTSLSVTVEFVPRPGLPHRKPPSTHPCPLAATAGAR